MNALRSVASFVRWRLVPVRYMMRVVGMRRGRLRVPPVIRTAAAEVLDRTGYYPGPTLDSQTVFALNEEFRPRTTGLEAKTTGHPFVELFTPADLSPANPTFRLAFSPAVMDMASDYFGGQVVLDSIQMLYSFSSPDGPLRESQKWHLDYGDRRTIHFIAYLNDVMTPEDGPFVFVNKADSRRVRSLSIVRRIDDETLRREIGEDAEIRSVYGRAGTSMFVDPAACYHYGSRGRNARLAMFVTFNSRRPFVQPTRTISDNARKIFEAAKIVRPDLSDEFLRGLLQLR